MGGLGKSEAKEDPTNSEKKEPPIVRPSETCTFGFNQIVKIQLFKLNQPKNLSESLKKEEKQNLIPTISINEKKILNNSSAECSNSNSYCLQNENESDLISETEKEFTVKKVHSAENISKIIESIKNEGSKSKNEGLNDIKSANYKIKTNDLLIIQNKDYDFKVLKKLLK